VRTSIRPTAIGVVRPECGRRITALAAAITTLAALLSGLPDATAARFQAVWVPETRLMDLDGSGHRIRFLIRGGDAKFTTAFDAVFTAVDIRILRTPVRAPRANAIAERFVGSIRRELLDRTLIINRRHAATVLSEYQHHLNSRRPHRALGQAAPLRPLPQSTTSKTNTVQRRDPLGGLLHEYQQVA
jgi:putative transposase